MGDHLKDNDVQEEPVDLSSSGGGSNKTISKTNSSTPNSNPFLDMWASAYGAAYANYLSLVGADTCTSDNSSAAWGDMLSKRAELERSVEEYMRHIRAAWEAKMHIESIYRENYQQLSLANMLMMGCGGLPRGAGSLGSAPTGGKPQPKRAASTAADIDVSNPANIFVIGDAGKTASKQTVASSDVGHRGVASAATEAEHSNIRLQVAKKSSSIFSMPSMLPVSHNWMGLSSRPQPTTSCSSDKHHSGVLSSPSSLQDRTDTSGPIFPVGRRIPRYRPLNGKHVRPGTGARISTLIALREKIQQRRRLKEVYAKVAFLRNLTSERVQEPGQVSVK